MWVELSYAASASLPGGFSLLRMRSGAPWLNPRPAPFLALKKMHAMKKPFTVVAVVIFAIVAVVHLLRFVLGWNANIAGTEIPMWASVVALVIAGGLAIGLWRENV